MPVFRCVVVDSPSNALGNDDDDDSDVEDSYSVPDEWDDIESDEDSDSEDPFGSIGVQQCAPSTTRLPR